MTLVAYGLKQHFSVNFKCETSLIYLFTYLFIYSFMYLFIYLFCTEGYRYRTL